MTEKIKNLDLDEIVSIEDVGVVDTYDFTIPETHCFFANGVLVHNSLEEDADIILFIHRNFEYSKKEDEKYEGDLEIAKQRSGPCRNIPLNWVPKLTTFTEKADT